MKPTHSVALLMILLTALTAVYASTPEFAAPAPDEESAQIPGVSYNAATGYVEPEDDASSDMIPQRLGILGAEVFLYDVSSGGIFEYRDDWSKLASRRAVISAALTLTGMGYEPTVVPDAAITRGLFNLKAKARYHCSAFRSSFYGGRSMYVRSMNAVSKNSSISAFYSSTLADTVKYSIGSVDSLCNRYGVDGFVYVYGFQENRDWRRLESKEPAPASARDSGRTYVAAILVGRDGRVLWYKDLAVTGAVDLRAGKYSAGIVGALFE